MKTFPLHTIRQVGATVVWIVVCGVLLQSASTIAQENPARSTTSPNAESPAPASEDSPESAADVQNKSEATAPGEDAKTAESVPAAEPPSAVKPAGGQVEDRPFSSQPYTVRASIAFESHCLVEDALRARIVVDAERALARMFGRLWDVQCEQNDWLVPGDQRHLKRLGLPNVLDRYPEQEFQKAFLITVECAGTSYLVSCREYDSRIRELTPVRSGITLDARAIGITVARLMRDTFRPTLLFVRGFSGEGGENMMEMQVQGGEIIPPDPSAEQVVEGDVLRPFLRQMERRDPTKLMYLQALPLTYLRVMDIDKTETRGLATTVYITHLRATMFGAKSRRTEHLAVRQRPSASRSRVRLVLKGRQDKPLISHRLALAYQLNWKSEEDGPQTQLVSDRNGEVVIETRENHPTFWIRVYSGTSLLARVPYAPGLTPFDTIELPDDSIRLGVEGEIQLLADELVDAIALREVLMARARKAVEASDEQMVTDLLSRYSSVRGKDYFLEQASNIRVTAEKEAAARRLSQNLINKLCKNFSETIENFFTDQKRAERQAEIQQLKLSVEQKTDAAGT